MFTHFDQTEKLVHFPQDRRFFIGLKPVVLLLLIIALLLTIGSAWVQYLFFGLPEDPSLKLRTVVENDPKGFPMWVILCHWVNFFFLVILIRSGLSILMNHPRLYWNNGCTPGSDWIKFTPVKVPTDRVWTAYDDARYISPVIGLPGYRFTIGLARGWHFIHVPFFVVNGLVFVALLFSGNHWQRIVPSSWQIFPDAWKVFVHYATFNMPYELNGFYHYNALQQLAYFAVIFIMAPLAMLSGMCMSPAIEMRFHWLPRLFGNRQGARSVHFLVMLGYVIFIFMHVTLVIATGLVRNMNHITLGTDSSLNMTGTYIGLVVVILVIAFCFYAQWVSWNRPRWVQKTEAAINGNLWAITINKLKRTKYFEKKDISPFIWPNGKLPTSDEWKKLAENDFRDYKLKIGGLVANPVELSFQDIKNLSKEESITMHHCVQGWTGIAEWGGLPMRTLVDLVKPRDAVTTVAFYSFGEGLFGGVYYETHTIDNCLKPGSLLAWEMNYKPLPNEYGAPLRLRIENQLGFKMVKWIKRIEFVETHKTIGKGYGGRHEDDEYFDLLADS